VVKNITYVLSITSSSDMKKPVAKRAPKTLSLQQLSNMKWDTIKAQILVKISTSLNPKAIDFSDYTILFFIPRIVLKPGMPLTTEQEYTFMIEQAMKSKTPMVNLTITENAKVMVIGDDKENDDGDEVEVEGALRKKASKVCICSFIWQHLLRLSKFF
jgi:hypothetical protein